MLKKLIEREKVLNIVLSELQNTVDLKGALLVLLRNLKMISNCECTAIRLEDDGDYPYYVYDGFPEDFIMKEKSLCSKDSEGNRLKSEADEYHLDCMCGNIIRGRFDAKHDFFTERGSFCSNNTSVLLATTSNEDRQANTRNYCNSCGYESVALIPIKAAGKNIGLIQLNDKRIGMFTPDLISFIENIGEMVGVFITNRQFMSKLKESEEAVEEANFLNKKKDMFLSNMSHEIRTPINGIIGMTQLLASTDLTKQQLDMLDVIKKSSNYLLRIVNDILDLSKIEAGTYRIDEQQFDFYELIKDVLVVNKIMAEKKDLLFNNSIDLTIPQYLIGDASRIKQVLNNLISNAIKFTEKGSVNIAIKKTKENNENIEMIFEITDTGIGISEKDITRLFQIFSQLDDSATKKYGGTGLGLALSKQLVELMGGCIWLKSVPYDGSTFSFSLTLQKGEKETVSDIKGNNKIVQSKWKIKRYDINILVVEDDYVNQCVLKMFFNNCGIAVTVTDRAADAIELIKTNKYDLMLLDIQLPDISGYQLATTIREREDNYYHLPIIAITAYALAGDRERCMEYGINEYLPKPINYNLLIELINKYI